MLLDLAQIGFTTTVLETAATTIAAGILMGGFVVGAIGVVRGRTRRELEERTLKDGYTGGIVAAGLLILDLVMRYVV